MSDIQAGAVVVLKSGGPKMTVLEIGEFNFTPNSALCTWFEDKKAVQESFPLIALKIYQPPSAYAVSTSR